MPTLEDLTRTVDHAAHRLRRLPARIGHLAATLGRWLLAMLTDPKPRNHGKITLSPGEAAFLDNHGITSPWECRSRSS